MKPRNLELLAPARNLATGMAAIDAGADAVYIGASSHGARAAAGNSVEDIGALCRYAHRFRARVYITLNTLVYDHEIPAVEQLVRQLYASGADALIVQDMALLRMHLPPIALHASTQANALTPEKARFLQDVGMSQIVLPRELTLDEIRAFAQAVTVPLEAFVHGALCVSYSGDCRASLLSGGRSANRGECAQICRLPFELVDQHGTVIAPPAHYLSLHDMNRLPDLEDMARAGVSSFKIEGRLKNEVYVRNVVLEYSNALNRLCQRYPDEFVRASVGRVTSGLVPDLSKTFNRGYTSYFLHGAQPPAGALAQMTSPKFIGPEVAKVVANRGGRLEVKLFDALHNGDGLTWIDPRKGLSGLLVNSVSGNMLTPAQSTYIPPGTTLHRNVDIDFQRHVNAARIERKFPLHFTLEHTGTGIALRLHDPLRALDASTCQEGEFQPANSPQQATRRDILARLGGTIYSFGALTDNLGDVFVPKSTLTALRRRALEMLDHAAEATMPLDLRRPEDANAQYPLTALTFHENVANALATRFYRGHGVKEIEPALEVHLPPEHSATQVMTCRYCLRRELGACLRTPQGKRLPAQLFLRTTSGKPLTFSLQFNCRDCRMTMHTTGKEPVPER